MPIISVSSASSQILNILSQHFLLLNLSVCGLCILCTVNDGRSAVPCAHSYFLFEPEDPVMKQNLLYYKAYSQQWGLQSNHFTPRMVR